MAIEGSVRVTPEKLMTTAQQFSSTNSTVKNLTGQMLQIIRETSSTWAGDASSAYLNKFGSLETDMTRISKMIEEHCMDLQEMARGYMDKEMKNTEASTPLPADIIV